MNSKQRAYLRKISAMEAPIFQVGKSSVTPELTAAIDEALEKRELIKLSVLKRTHSSVVHVIGRKIVLYRPAKEEKNRKIILP
mgnify:CR=1 FL=1